MKSSILAPLILLIAGICLLTFGTKEIIQVNSFVSNGEEADGVIIEMRKGSTKYRPLVRFQTKQGVTYEFLPGNGSNPPMYEVGEHVPVIYNPAAPSYAVINTFIEIWLGPLIYAGVGLLLFFSSWLSWKKSSS